MEKQREMIGGVTLNYDCYGGTDLYSDGPVEEEMLSIVKEEDPADLDRVAAKRKNWPIYYHLSSGRWNLLSFYPFRKEDKILEIGSGCGAVTGVLAANAGSVTCVELSKRRSLINAYRHRACSNIEIRVGNYQDVETTLPCDYDIVTFIGVFEYGNSYIRSETPYLDFLLQAKKHLKKGGVLLLAIENRLGLKYFAGCKEDHTGTYFEGLSGYEHSDYVRTFSKPRLTELLNEAGFTDQTWYYPHPDYKFPTVIYSDQRLPMAGELKGGPENLDQERLLLFEESRVFDSLIGDGLYPLFANSFLIAAKEA